MERSSIAAQDAAAGRASALLPETAESLGEKENTSRASAGFLAFLVTFACALTLSAQSPDVVGSWNVVQSPNGGNQPEGNILFATVALSSTDAWAVGVAPNTSQYLTTTLAEHWNGTQWSIVPTPPIATPTARLNSLAAVSSSDIWAAGYAEDPSCFCSETVIEHWNGDLWTRVASPNAGLASYLNGITAVSASDIWAVGYQWISQSSWKPLLLHYDGNSWSLSRAPRLPFGQLSAVFALAADDVWAVGWIGLIPSIQGLVLHWDGRSWRRVTFPTETGGWTVLKGISGVATTDLWAVGSYNFFDFNGNPSSSARSYRWDGSRWNAVPVGLGGYSYLTSVTATATNDVWAVGAGLIGIDPTYRYVTFHWDGRRWSNVPNPNQGVLYGVSASSSSDVWAAGLGFVTPGTHTIRYTEP